MKIKIILLMFLSVITPLIISAQEKWWWPPENDFSKSPVKVGQIYLHEHFSSAHTASSVVYDQGWYKNEQTSEKYCVNFLYRPDLIIISLQTPEKAYNGEFVITPDDAF